MSDDEIYDYTPTESQAEACRRRIEAVDGLKLAHENALRGVIKYYDHAISEEAIKNHMYCVNELIDEMFFYSLKGDVQTVDDYEDSLAEERTKSDYSDYRWMTRV